MIKCKICEDVAEQLIYPQGVYRCLNCGLLFREKWLDSSWYKKNDYWYQRSEELVLHAKARFAWFEDYILHGPTIEFGAGDGDFTMLLRENISAIHPVVYSELVDRLWSHYNQYEIGKWIGRIEDYPTTSVFDNVFLIDVIEHLNEPLDALKKINQMMATNGRLFISTNDGDAFDSFLPLFYHIEHICIFTRKAIFKLAEKAGFRIYKYFQAPQSWLYIILEKTREL